ncbi:hypothetical protein J3Q64DRAFT_1841471 [Phycomyces blakesleeanus]|uniref:Uncharacterized protein n=2 Tax=Phycomyces blakesleeanus TaxID=4837 RepID=A0A167LXK3_PHYB8|nr:hypothetical protein PHYBLDRAFT_182204 [Phycomyces blakesleeanus NRRL 1555(-)]OAD71297.1 hypothetical protein PHYBLDRAFT_182204 [Phycomyces blakesleeanus NRRL 1555(-)]|eukprot:XP_018289337.1 hypothetical protein PHYBLDRAFT_182204 [Phycomyces blakesleeanus NRRL 1555(-)]
MVPVDEVFDSKKQPEHPLSGHLPERDRRLSIRSRSASPSAYVFAPSWILSPTEKPGLRTTSLAFSSFGKRTHRESDLKDRFPRDPTNKSLLASERTAVKTDDNNPLSPRPSASSPSPRRLPYPSQHAPDSSALHTDVRRPAKALRNNSCTDLTKLPPSDTMEEFPTLANNAPDLTKHPTSSPWGKPHLIKEVFAQPAQQEDNVTNQSCDPELARLKALVPKRISSTAIKKHTPAGSSHSNRPRSTTGKTLPTRLSSLSVRQFPKRTTESPTTPDEKRSGEENTDTSGLKDYAPEIETPTITDEDKERFLNLVRVWTGGAVRWENNCGVLPRSPSPTMNAKPLLPVGSDRLFDRRSSYSGISPFEMGPLKIHSQEPCSETDCSIYGSMDNGLLNPTSLYSVKDTDMNGVRDRWMFAKAPSSSLYYVM